MQGQALGHAPSRCQVETVTWAGFFRSSCRLELGMGCCSNVLCSEGTASVSKRCYELSAPDLVGGGYFCPVSLKDLVSAVITVILRSSQV